MKWKRLFLGLAFFASVNCLTTSGSHAQTLSGADANSVSSAQITTDSGAVFNPRRQNKVFERVGLKPGQATNVTTAFSISVAGQTFSAAPLDGGTVTLSNQGRVGSDGSVSLTFKAGTAVGLYRVLVSQGESVQILQFWVRDLANPQNNPPVYPGS